MQRFACNALKRIGALSEKRFFSTSCVRWGCVLTDSLGRSRRLLPSCSTQFARPLGQWNSHSPFAVFKRFEGSVPVPEGNPDSKEDARSRVCSLFEFLKLGSVALHSWFENNGRCYDYRVYVQSV